MVQGLYERFAEQGRLSADDVRELLPEAEETGVSAVETEDQIARMLAAVAECEYVDLSRLTFQQDAIALLPAKVAVRAHAVPVALDGDTLVVATYDPLDVNALDRVERVTGMDLRVTCAPKEQVLLYMERHYGSAEQADVEHFIRQSRQDVAARSAAAKQKRSLFFAEYETDLGQTPVEQLVESIVAHASKKRATDIHITRHTSRIELQFRIDGVLQTVMPLPEDLYAALLSRVKLTAGMDITTHHFPQEGNFEVLVDGAMVQIRASIFPTIQGEDIALRLQYRAMYQKDFGNLGFADWKLKQFIGLLDMPKGMILVTGPVGVGKTTTLYSALSRIAGQSRKIVTLEDPVESRLDHVAQSQISPTQGYGFALGLKTILRMDPDVIMVGEIRDNETAGLALRASLTGMLVLSTLHTDRAAGAIPRLLDMDIEPYLLTSSLLGVLSQALVRRICDRCREPVEVDREFLIENGVPEDRIAPQYYHGAGCDRCGQSGYYGRTGVFEMLIVNDAVREAVKRRSDLAEIYRVAREEGMETMVEDGLGKAAEGVTTVEDVFRVAKAR